MAPSPCAVPHTRDGRLGHHGGPPGYTPDKRAVQTFHAIAEEPSARVFAEAAAAGTRQPVGILTGGQAAEGAVPQRSRALALAPQ